MEWAQWVLIVGNAIVVLVLIVGMGMQIGGHQFKPMKVNCVKSLVQVAINTALLYLAGAFSHIF